jgi:hypothetical protein
MQINQRVVVFDTDDLAAESAFWAGVLGGAVSEDADDWHTVSVDGVPVVAAQLAPGHVRPQWPDGAPQQAHLDLWVEDIEIAHAEVTVLGACLLQSADDNDDPADDPDDYQVYADPAGHPFCLCWAKPVRPAAGP